MKNIILIILTFFTLSLFGQTEQPDEFRAPTGVIKSVRGTNFKKSTKVIGGKNVTVYEQPNTDTYNTFSIVNDSVRIQKWKLDTATNVFVTSSLNDVYLDNLVNKPSVDSRVVLDMVNDSLKVEVWDIINNTLLSTYYIDNVGNHAETVTTLTNTIPNGNLIGTYTNEAGAVVNIKETLTAYNDQTTSTPHLIGKYLDEFGNLTDINETLTSLNSTLSTGHLIGQYINEDNVGVSIKESIIGVVNNADGSATITKEDGTTVTTTPYPNTNFVQTNDSLWIHTNLDGSKDTIKVPLPTVNTDTRLQLSVVNDSIKIEVVDVLTNTVTSTSYLDNMVNQPEIITTITDTLVGGHLIANYTNEANTIRGIYESVIKVDSITNGYVITKEDGTKDTIKINSTGFYTLTDISDTLALSAVAASKCPALTIAKLDSCNVAYLYMFNCEASHWELFKTPNIYTAGKTLFVDEVTGNDATAKKGCPTCAWKEINVASLSTQYENEDNISVNTGIYNMPIGAFEGKNTAYLSLENGVKINGVSRSIGQFLPTTIDKVRVVGDGFIENTGGWAYIWQFEKKQECLVDILKYKGRSPLYDGGTKKVILNVKDVEMTGSGVFAYHSATDNSNVAINVENLYSRRSGFGGWQPGFIHPALEYGGQTSFQDYENNDISIYVKNVKWERPVGSILYIYSNNGGGKLYKNNRQTLTIDNLIQYNIDSLTQSYVALDRPWRSVFSFGTDEAHFDIVQDNTKLFFKNAITDYRLVDFYDSCTYTDCNLTLKGDKSIVKKLQTILSTNNTFINSEIIIDGDYENFSGLPLVQFANTTFINSKIILKGNFSSNNKLLEITGGSFDATSVIELQGTFKTTSTTLPAIDINNSRLYLKDCDIITGGGYSIDSATPVNVTVKPGCSSNVTTSANITQLGTGIYVDPNFNN